MNKFDEMALLLETAARILRKHDQPERERLDRAAWRIADAALLLKQGIGEHCLPDVIGVHTPTGRGALL